MSSILEHPSSPKCLANLAIPTSLLPLLYSRVLITTDGWARGISVQQVYLVINYDLPSYVFFVQLCYGALEPYWATASHAEIVKITFAASVDLVDLEGASLST